MANKAVSDLTPVSGDIGLQDFFLLERNAKAYKFTGEQLLRYIETAAAHIKQGEKGDTGNGVSSISTTAVAQTSTKPAGTKVTFNMTDSSTTKNITVYNGSGIKSIDRTKVGTPGTNSEYTITYTDSSVTPSKIEVYNGADGAAGVFTATATLLTNAWTAEWAAGDVWIQYVDVPGLLSSDQPIMSYDFPSGTTLGVQSAIKEEWNVLRSWTGDGRLAVRMIGKPTHEIMIRLFCVRN